MWSNEKGGRGETFKIDVEMKSPWQEEQRQIQEEVVQSIGRNEGEKHPREYCCFVNHDQALKMMHMTSKSFC